MKPPAPDTEFSSEFVTATSDEEAGELFDFRKPMPREVLNLERPADAPEIDAPHCAREYILPVDDELAALIAPEYLR